ncbi:MAG: hypothetical protein K9M49_04485 [Candidatus Marinimicrobia bacterium]|nr:hypothetical protein [Candidatus Neomarinimicrobiota bacterium]MCF7904394.1 hypothetical protein [Candidatus Neomarinimicrobiota bacterium]
MNKKLIIVLLILVFTANIFAQVTISPTSLFIDSKRRFETLLIMNTSATAQEVKLRWEFGYPITDENGNMTMTYGDTIPGQEHSAAGWIRGFPKSFILEAGARQTIRITAKAPRGLDSGTYWTRMITTSSAISPSIGDTQPGGITAQINLQFNQITSVYYKHGELDCGIEITDVRPVVSDESVRIIAGYEKLGNSPFLGTMAVKVYDVLGDIVKNERIYISIFNDGWHRIDFDATDLPMGSYDYEISFFSGRADVPDSDIIPIETVTAKGSFTKL